MIGAVAWQGMVAGIAGAAVMSIGENIEQRWSRRPNSHVPGLVLARLTGRPDGPGQRSQPLNWAMHYGQGAAVGVLRAGMAHAGLRGPLASAMFTVVRLTSDQLLENATGVGAPPQTWPRRELVVDVAHKTIYGFTTGLVADLLAARSGPGPGQVHAAARAGRHSDVGPVARPTVKGVS
jgi:hypothetical protein